MLESDDGSACTTWSYRRRTGEEARKRREESGSGRKYSQLQVPWRLVNQGVPCIPLNLLLKMPSAATNKFWCQ